MEEMNNLTEETMVNDTMVNEPINCEATSEPGTNKGLWFMLGACATLGVIGVVKGVKFVVGKVKNKTSNEAQEETAEKVEGEVE